MGARAAPSVVVLVLLCAAVPCAPAGRGAGDERTRWLPDAAAERLLPLLDGDRVVERRAAGSFTAAEFRAEFRHQKPVLIHGFEEAGLWPAATRDAWQRAALSDLLSGSNASLRSSSGAGFVVADGRAGTVHGASSLLDDVRAQHLANAAAEPGSAPDDHFTFDVELLGVWHQELIGDWRGLDRFVGFRVRQEDVQLDGPLSMMTKSKPVFSLGASVSLEAISVALCLCAVRLQ